MTDATNTNTDPVNSKPISDGDFLLFRKDSKKLRRPGIIGTTAGKAHPPRFRHPTFEAAETEAQRLLQQLPDSTFIILREVGRVKAERTSAQ